MSDLIEMSKLLKLIVDIILAVAALIGIIKAKQKWIKVVWGILLLVIIVSLCLSFYLQPKGNSITANLHLSIYEPLVVNVNGTYNDTFIENANYRVLCSKAYSIDTRISVVIINEKTKVKNDYIVSDVYYGKDIGNIESGKYSIETYINGELMQTDTILLSTENLDDNANWDCLINIFGEFYENAKKCTVSIGKENINKVIIPAFTIHSDDDFVNLIFKTEYIDTSGTFEGDFFFLPGDYYLNNAVTPHTMDEIPFLIGEN